MTGYDVADSGQKT